MIRRFGFASLAFLSWTAPAYADGTLFIGDFPVEQSAKVLESQIVLEVPEFKGKQFGELGRRKLASPLKDGQIVVKLQGYPVTRDAVLPRHRKCSFIVDCDEMDVIKLKRSIIGSYGEKPSSAELTEFVGQHIAVKNYARGFDAASAVARRREGDCSEHAVLLAAIARLYKLPSRVVLGLVLVEDPSGKHRAFGHAWTEIHDGKGWQLADAALLPPKQLSKKQRAALPRPVAYLPVRLLDDESLSYNASMMKGVNVTNIARVLLP